MPGESKAFLFLTILLYEPNESEISRGGLEPHLSDPRTYYLCYRPVLDFKMLKAFRAVSVIFVLFIICISGPFMGRGPGTPVKIKTATDQPQCH